MTKTEYQDHLDLITKYGNICTNIALQQTVLDRLKVEKDKMYSQIADNLTNIHGNLPESQEGISSAT